MKKTNNEIKHTAHSSYRCQYHVVFAPKYRRKEIYGQLRKDIGEILSLTSRINSLVAIPKKEENIYAYKVDFKMSVYLCREFLRNENADGIKLLEEISSYKVPIRPGRSGSRNIKVKGAVPFVYRVAA